MKQLEGLIPLESLPERAQLGVQPGLPHPGPFLGSPYLTGVGRIVQRVGPGSDGIHQRHTVKPQVGVTPGKECPLAGDRLLGGRLSRSYSRGQRCYERN